MRLKRGRVLGGQRSPPPARSDCVQGVFRQCSGLNVGLNSPNTERRFLNAEQHSGPILFGHPAYRSGVLALGVYALGGLQGDFQEGLGASATGAGRSAVRRGLLLAGGGFCSLLGLLLHS